MDGVRTVSFEGAAALEFHYAAEFVSLRAWGDVFADPGFEQAGDAALKVADFRSGALLLFRRDAGFPAEGEHVEDHRRILTFLPNNPRPLHTPQ